MDDVNWRRVFAISSLVMALMLVCGSIYLHLQQKHHLGRMHYPSRTIAPVTVEAAESAEQHKRSVKETLNYLYETSGQSDEVMADLSPQLLKLLRLLDLNVFTGEEQEAISSESAEIEDSTNEVVELLNENCTKCLRDIIDDFGGPRCCSDQELPCGLIGVNYAKCLEAKNDNESTIERYASATAECVKSVKCARQAVAALVSKYFRDCNQDDTRNCRRNQAAARMFGPSGCASNELLSIFESRMVGCV